MEQVLPKQVQEQLAAAEAIEKQLAGQPPEDEPETEETVEATSEEVVDEEPEVEEKAPEPKPEPDGTVWESKYRTLQSKYDIEVPRLHQQNRDLAEQLTAMQKQIDEIGQAPEPEKRDTSYVSDKDEEEFGSDLIDLQRRIAREQNAELLAQINALKTDNAKMAKQLGAMEQSTARTSEEVFYEKVGQAVPDWEAINQRQDWLDWLAEVDPLTGMNKQAYLNAAHQNLDANRVIAIFSSFKELQAPKQTQSELKRQVTPTRAASSSQAVQNTGQKKIWAQAEIAQALDPRNLRKMSADDITALNAEIDAAMREGRIR